jgi:UDP-N-acetylglucosamine--N-acetylmuramyl-(pentapeptide) pyrophosphoryl-undecaprenol N-acetylglucosamine transferase
MKMKILSVGGGSGGHVTPVVAVLREIKTQHPKTEFQFWCDYHYAPQARSIIEGYDSSIPVSRVLSGKLRRYHHLTLLQHLIIPSVIFPNIRDAFLVFAGVGQSLIRLVLWRPDVIFANGGYVCLPVGWAAWLLRIPLVIHDADAVPGITNRLLAPLAKGIGTGLSLDHFNYPASKAKYVGTAIDPRYKVVTEAERKKFKAKLGFDTTRPLTVFAGGGQGSRQINDAVALHLQELLKHTNVLLLSGAAQYDELVSLTPQNDPRFVLKDFVPGLIDVFSAADIVVSRAGATALLELAAMAMPTIIIPSKRLVWQVEHVKIYEEKEAVLVLDEDKFEKLGDTSLVQAVQSLVGDESLQKKLSSNLHKMATPNAAKDMASIILHAARKRN